MCTKAFESFKIHIFRHIFRIDPLPDSFSLASVCRSSNRSARPVWGLPGSSLPGVLRLPPGLLCKGPEPPGPAAQQNPHLGQLPRLLHLPPRECCEFSPLGHKTGWLLRSLNTDQDVATSYVTIVNSSGLHNRIRHNKNFSIIFCISI